MNDTYSLETPAVEEPARPLVVGAPTETYPGEKRVALTPANVAALEKAGLSVVIQSGAGVAAGHPDEEYTQTGAEVVENRADVFAKSDVIVQVRTVGANPEHSADDVAALRDGQTLIGMCNPLGSAEQMKPVAERGATCLALELLPRITRAQSMDVLSSMATVAGYKAVLLAANALPRLFPMMMTAAGTLTPARVLIVGVGVAGLQAISAARRLGAVVQAYDIRPAVKEEVQSLGAKFVELEIDSGSEGGQSGGYARQMDEEFYRKQRELMTQVISESDVVITTAAVPGKKAPVLVTADMVRAMPEGSVLVDMAAEQGGNCELTKPGETVQEGHATILGPINIPASIPTHASQMYAKNVTTFLLHLLKDGQLDLDRDDEIIAETLVTRGGEVVNARVREILGLESLQTETSSEPESGSEGEN